MVVIAIFNRHPGCGKTALACNLLAAFARRGERPLAVDLDPKAALSAAFGARTEDEGGSSTGLLRGTASLDDIAQITRSGVVVCPAHAGLASLRSEFGKGLPFLLRLGTALATARRDFGVVLIDCAGAWDALSLNAVIASDLVVIPVGAIPGTGVGARSVARGLDALAPVLRRRVARKFVAVGRLRSAARDFEVAVEDLPATDWLSTRITNSGGPAASAGIDDSVPGHWKDGESDVELGFAALADELSALAPGSTPT